jgi:hypothetical protein
MQEITMSRETELLVEIESLKAQPALGKRQMKRAQFDSLPVADKHRAVREYQLVD